MNDWFLELLILRTINFDPATSGGTSDGGGRDDGAEFSDEAGEAVLFRPQHPLARLRMEAVSK